MKLKMRKLKSYLRRCKRKLEEYYNAKIYKLSFPKYQLKLILDSMQLESRICKSVNSYSMNAVKIK